MKNRQRKLVEEFLAAKEQGREWHQQHIQLREGERRRLHELAKEMNLPLRDVVVLGMQLVSGIWEEMQAEPNEFAQFWKRAERSLK